MIDVAFGLWNFKPDERLPFPSMFTYANGRFLASFAIVKPDEIEEYLHMIPELEKQWDRISPWIVKSDLARLVYVYLRGGFYFDSDCEIVRRIQPAPNVATLFTEAILPSTSVLGPREDKSPDRRHRIANYAFGCPTPRHPFFKACIDECLRRLEEIEYTAKTPQDVLWVCGPDVITTIYHTYRFPVRLLGQNYVKHHAVGSWRDQTERR
jgi:mannosyltransferase OCH1-like enzyme